MLPEFNFAREVKKMYLGLEFLKPILMKLFYTSLLALSLSTSMIAQENVTYQKPSKEILALTDYERAPSVSMDSKKEYMLLSYRNTYKTLDDLNQEEMKLGGLRINPITNISSTVTYINNIKLRKIKNPTEQQVQNLPSNPKIAHLSWSPDESKIAFTHTTAQGVELWVVDVATAVAKKLTADNLNANLGSPLSWFKDSQSLLVRQLPQNRSALIDQKNNLPAGPIVSVSQAGTVSQNRTYQDLLKNKVDETNFENLTTSELHKVDLQGKSSLYKPADMYAGESFSPDGSLLMTTTLQKPFSYIVPLNRFPMTTSVYKLDGSLVKVVNETPLNEIMPKGFMAVREGKRNMAWRADQPATLYYVVALDEGNPAHDVAFRDEVFSWKAPFDQAARSLLKTP